MWEHWQLASGRPRWAHKLDEIIAEPAVGLCMGRGALLEEAWTQCPSRLEGLRYLVIEERRIRPSTLAVIAELTSLQRLHLTHLFSSDLTFLDDLVDLEYLCIEGAPKVVDDTPFPQHDRVKSLGLGTGLQRLEPLAASYPNLRCLVLHGPGESNPARFKDLCAISTLEDLEHLALLNCRTADKRLKALMDLPRLETLAIGSHRWWDKRDIEMLRSTGIHVSDFIELA